MYDTDTDLAAALRPGEDTGADTRPDKDENDENEGKLRFEDFPLRHELLTAIARKGFSFPMPVQVSILEDDQLTEGDLIVQARTGSGKTLAFALPIYNAMTEVTREPQVLVLSPTRELAQQTAREFAWLGADMGARVATLVGGLDMERQIKSLRDGAAVVVGTPGRVLDHIRRGSFRTEGVRVLVLDEGDHMLDMGFRDELEAIMSSAEGLEKTWLFSATMPPEVVSLARKYLDTPRRISLVSDVTCHEDITQRTYIIPSRRRFEGLANVLLWENPSRALVFCSTKAETQEICDRLCDEGFRAAAIHGDMSQRERGGALASLRGGRAAILVATDVAARGLDIDGVSHVIQYGLPSNLETFVHRSGRTGRAGREGANLVLLTGREARQFRWMTQSSGMKTEILPAPDASEIDGAAKARFTKSLSDHARDSEEYLEWADELLDREDTRMLVAGLLARAYGDMPRGSSIRADVQAEFDRGRDRGRQGGGERGDRGERGSRPPRPDMTGGAQILIDGGRADGWDVGRLLGAVCRALGISRNDVGNIRLRDSSAAVELSAKAAALLDSRRQKIAREGISITGVKAVEARREDRAERGEWGDRRPPRRRDHSEGDRRHKAPKAPRPRRRDF